MCGIVGYIGDRQAADILLDGLQRLEYRGYDSAGIVLYNGSLDIYKKDGKVSSLVDHVKGKEHNASIGLGHTRWATHGQPNEVNAHPHSSMHNCFVMVHNGIIENYAEIKEDLKSKGYVFYSDTDSETLVNLIEYTFLSNKNYTSEDAVRFALNKVVGSFAIAVLSKTENNKIIVARRSSPLVIGIGENEYFIASDAIPIVKYTKEVIYLNDDELAVIEKNNIQLKNLNNEELSIKKVTVDLEIEKLEKGGYDYFMLKEIYEQPQTLTDTFNLHVNPEKNDIILNNFDDVLPKMAKAHKIVIIACGTSLHAAMIGEYLIEELAEISVEVEFASEYRYRKPVVGKGDFVIGVSQSGETADTLAALRLAKNKGATVLGICNVAGSTIDRETDACIYTYAGVEIGVASTKAFTAQVMIFSLIALKLSRILGNIDENDYRLHLKDLSQIPDKVSEALNHNSAIKKIAETLYQSENALYLGRGFYFPIAMEGALKIKEISYIHAEGCAAGEMKHGPIALVDEKLPVIFVALKDDNHEKIISNIREIKAREGRVIAVITEGDQTLGNYADDIMVLPKTNRLFSPILAIVPLQLLAYHVAVLRGCDVDQPRNLAKSVTVE